MGKPKDRSYPETHASSPYQRSLSAASSGHATILVSRNGKVYEEKKQKTKAKQRSTCGLSIKWITKTGIQTKENIREEELLELDLP